MENNNVITIQEKYILKPSVIERIRNILNKSPLAENNIDYEDEETKFNKKFSETFEEILQTKSKNLRINISKSVNENYELENRIKKNMSSGKRLPILKYKNEILQKISEQTFTLINGGTGCGKSTQVPQMILDDFIANSKQCTIICTQPRQISAISLADRVAKERGKILNSVGFQIRLEKCMPNPKIGTILYCTTGVLLRKMEHDSILSKYTHVILDEIHERSVEMDLLIGLLKIVVKYNKNLKIILMSATYCIEEFIEYFGEVSLIQIPGKLFEVKVEYLEDILQTLPFDFKKEITQIDENNPNGKYTDHEIKEFKKLIQPYAQELHRNGTVSYEIINTIQNQNSEGVNLLYIKSLIFHITKNQPKGAILVFLPGYDKIEDLFRILTNSPEYIRNRASFKMYRLHSLLSTEKQRGIFVRPKNGVRKIILSTTIAETSITIDDVVYIINPGRVKVNNYDIKNNYEELVEKWITKAQSIQRKGRAGRCQPGICYNLYTRARESTFNEFSVPEIQRCRLEPTILRLKFMHINNIYKFFETLLNCPNKKTFENGIELLKRINALDDNQRITPLGSLMARLPVDPQIAKMLVISSVFQCVDPITSVCATLSHKEPFHRSMKRGENLYYNKLEISNGSYSDELVYAYVIEDYFTAKKHRVLDVFVEENEISVSIMKQLIEFKNQLNDILKSAGFIDKFSNTNAEMEHLLKGVIAAGLYPNVAYVQSATKVKKIIKQQIITPADNKKVVLHSWSVNHKSCEFDSKFLVYCGKRKGKKEICVYDSTMVFPDSLIIFGDKFEIINSENGLYIIKISDNIEFITNYESLQIIRELRIRFEMLLRKLALNPKKTEADNNLLEALILFLICEID